MKQTNYHFQYSILINSSYSTVWDLLIDVSRWKEWDTELLDASLSGSFSEGARGTLVPKKGPKLNFWISEVMDDRTYTFITKMPVGSLEIKRTLKRVDDKIEFTDDIRFTGFLKRLFGLMLGGGFKSVLPEVMNNFKRLAEEKNILSE
ncbi:MAG: SRPBCC family protein [Bacteroidota bacterium]